MKKVEDKWYECEDGHVTAGGIKKAKCDAELFQYEYVHGKRKFQWKTEIKPAGKCGKAIVAEGVIPDELDYFTVWDHKTMHAFLLGQKFDAEFIIGLQKAFSQLKEKK